MLSCEHNVNLEANKLETVVAQACLCVARITKVVEDTHNSKVAEALLMRQHLEKASTKTIDWAMEEIQGAHTPADMWWVEKKISVCISHERAKAYRALVEQHHSKPELPMGKDGSGGGSSRMAEVEEEFHKSISDLISTALTKGAKVPGGHGVALTSNILWLVPCQPLNLVLMPCIDLPLEKECRIILGEMLRSIPTSHGTPSLLPSLPLTGGISISVPASRSTIRFGQAIIWPVTHMLPAVDYTFFRKPLSIEVPAPPKGWESPGATSTPMSKAPPKSSLDDLDTPESMVDLMGLGEDHDDETFTPHNTDSSKSRETHRSSKWWGSPPAKKACIKSPASQKTSKSKSCKSSRASWDEQEECEDSKKEPEYKKMHYLTFAPVTDLEWVIFKKCFFDQPPMSHLSPPLGFGQAFSRFQEHLQQYDPLAPTEQGQYWPFLERGYGPSESSEAVLLCFQCSWGPYPMEVSEILNPASHIGRDRSPHGGFKEVLGFP